MLTSYTVKFHAFCVFDDFCKGLREHAIEFLVVSGKSLYLQITHFFISAFVCWKCGVMFKPPAFSYIKCSNCESKLASLVFITVYTSSSPSWVKLTKSQAFNPKIVGTFGSRPKFGDLVYHNDIVGTLKMHLCPSHIGQVLRLAGAVSPDVLHFDLNYEKITYYWSFLRDLTCFFAIFCFKQTAFC